MTKFKPKDILIPTVSLFIICLIITALLAGTNMLTKAPIEEQTILKAQQSRNLVLPKAKTFEEIKGLKSESCFKALDENSSIIGYAITTKAKGYGGDVEVLVGIDSGSIVTGVIILSHNETPGLGANATKDEYKNQYKQEVPNNGFSVIKNATPKNGEVEALTGATITSNAVTLAVNQAVEVYNTELKGGAK